MDLVLTDQQQRFFDTFGFLRLPGLIADIIDDVIEDFEAIWAARGGGHNGQPHDGSARSTIFPFIDQHERLCTLLDDPRIHGIATSLLGEDFNYLGGDGNYYVGDTNWHPDGRHVELKFIKIAFYLDPVDATSGALRLIPGSHKIGDRFGDSIKEALAGMTGQEPVDAYGVTGDRVPAVAMESRPGDIVVFNHNMLHSSWGGGNRRRMFTMNLCEHAAEHLVPELRSFINGHAAFWVDSMIGPKMLETATPQRMRHFEQVLANQDEMPELLRKARETMSEPVRG